MARVGGARSTALAIASAVLAVLGCALGSLVAEILVLLRQHLPMSEILANLNIVFRFYPKAVGGLGFLFWVFAALYGYRIASGMPMRWGLGRRRMRAPVPGQPYGTGQAFGAEPGGGTQPTGAAQPGDASGAAQPGFGFKQPPPGFGSPPQS